MSYIGNEPIVSATRTVTEITATAGQTVFTANGGYTVGYIDVFVNGSQLTASDFTATNGSTITLNEAATVNDVVRLVAWGTFQTSNITSGSLSAGGITWSQDGGVTLPRVNSSSEGGQLNFSRASDNTTTWSIDSFGSTSTPSLRFIDGANVRMTLDDSGNVGIGTTTPLYTFANRGSLTINGTSQALLALSNGSSTSTSAYHLWDGANYYINNQSTSGNVIFGTNASAERMRITSSGNLLVGTTSSIGRITAVNAGTDSASPVVYANNTSGSTTAWTFYSRLESGSNTASAAHFGGITGSSAWYLLGNGTSSWSSDINLKKNVETTRDGYAEDLCKLRVVKYNWKNHEDDSPKELGLIAQEVEKVFPGLVMDSLTPDDDGVYHKMIKGSVLPFMLLKAIQELKAELDNAKAEIELLKGAQ